MLWVFHVPCGLQRVKSYSSLAPTCPAPKEGGERRALILREGVKAQLPFSRSMGLLVWFCPLAFLVIFKAVPFLCWEGIFKILFPYLILRERERERASSSRGEEQMEKDKWTLC